MDFDLVRKGLELTIKKRKWILILGAFGFTTFGAYKIYSSPSFVKKRQRLLKLFGALFAVAEVVYDSSEAIGILSKDMKDFLASDSDQIPQSFKQASKITVSNEFTESLTHVTRAVTVGILQGYFQETAKNTGFIKSWGFSDRVLDKLFSDAGSGFASIVIGSFTRNLVMAFYSNYEHYLPPKSDQQQSFPTWIEVACEDKYRQVIGDFIRVFVSTAVTVYLDKTMNINTYDQIFSGLTNPKHEARVRDLLVSVSNGAVETYIRTANHIASSDSPHPVNHRIGYEDGDNIAAKWISATLGSKKLKERVFFNQEKGGWISKVSSAFAVPRNRKFVLDITGTVTFESVRSFLEFLAQKLSDCAKRSIEFVQHEAIDRGAEAVRYASSKSSVVITVCITLCLHVLNGPWVFTYYA